MAKLNKFFALKTNFNGDPAEMGGGGSNASTAKASPVFLDTYTKVQEQIDNLDAQLLRMFPDISAEEMDAKQVAARRELVALAEKNPAINFSQEDFLKAVGAVEGGPLTPAQAIAQYYGIDLDETYGNNRLKIGGGGLKLTDNVASRINNYAKENPDSGTFSTLDFSVLPDLVDASDVQVATNYDLLSPDQLVSELDKFVPRDRQVARVTQDTPAFTVADKLGTTMFDRINFPERTINRGVPVVTKGIDAQGNPTTGITMGTAAASPSGPTIGELDISAILPSTGMGINADGTGTTTVGTQSTTGNMVNQGPVTPVVTPTPITPTTTPPTIGAPQQPLSIVEQIAQIVREEEESLGTDFSEANKALAIERGKKRIADLGMATEGGISAEQVAAGGRASGANRLLNLDTAATVDAVRDVIQREYQPDFSADTPYMVEDKTVYTFAHGGEVEDSRDAAVGSRLMAQAGIGSMQAKNMSPEMSDSLDRIMARRK